MGERMAGFVDNELERTWKETVVAYLRSYPGTYIQELNKTKNTSVERDTV
jgi:hypothetical protein